MSENGLHKIPAMRAALVAIQELHKPVETYLPTYDQQGNPIFKGYPQCADCGSYEIPCPTRKLADEGLGGGQNV
ncbi:hypothetical protein ACTXIU_16615 [Glutamicibacter arilaitensis]|uniref:hypothetical protein n=1 Tax=Glutamicibacter arilaitensis TaxID=256701 RepID=UPI003FD2C4F0